MKESTIRKDKGNLCSASGNPNTFLHWWRRLLQSMGRCLDADY